MNKTVPNIQPGTVYLFPRIDKIKNNIPLQGDMYEKTILADIGIVQFFHIYLAYARCTFSSFRSIRRTDHVICQPLGTSDVDRLFQNRDPHRFISRDGHHLGRFLRLIV